MDFKFLNKKLTVLITLFIVQSILSLSFINTSIWYSTRSMVMRVPYFFVFIMIFLSVYYFIGVRDILFLFKKELEMKDMDIKLKESNEVITYLRQHKHDFFNHLQVVRGLAQINKTDRISEYIDAVVGNVSDVFSVSTITKPEIAVVIMQKLGETVKYGIETEVYVGSDLGELKGNSMDYSQILFNLFDNAIYALRFCETTDKKLTLNISEDECNYVFSINNNNPIIPDELKARVFDKGFSTKNVKDGGLGLYIVKTLVEKNKGSIELISNQQEGTTFEITFPRYNRNSPAYNKYHTVSSRKNL